MRADRSGRALERRCRAIVAGLALPSPFDVVEFFAMLSRARDRRIELIPVGARPDLPCGVLLTTDRADYVLYAADTSPLHREHILLHEAAHIVCGHHTAAAGAPSGGAMADAARLLMPSLPAALVERVLGRTVYSEPQEREAELVASLLRMRAARDDGRPAAPRTRLESLFDQPEGRGPRHG